MSIPILDFSTENGLVMCQNHESAVSSLEILHIEKAKKLGASAVLFRRYFDSQNEHYKSTPSVYIFEKEKAFEKQTDTDLHAKIWSAGEVEVYMIVGKNDLKIINARHPAEIKDNALFLDNLILASEFLEKFNDQRFSAHIFGKGMFWEQGSWELDEKQTPFEIILDQLEKTRTRIQKKYTDVTQRKVADKILLLSILIMFLQEKKDKEDSYALKNIFEKRNVSHFKEILRNDNLLDFLDELSNNYNGNIFSLTEEEKNNIPKLDLSDVALFVEGLIDIETKQYSIWRKYDFDFIPIELISSIYENFLQSENDIKEKGVVYTPPFLVNFLIDEVMPLNLPKENYLKNDKIAYKVLDPSCGSGIFLVAAYKRLLDWWAINNFEKLETLPQKKISDVFKQILEDNIFGVDINETATQISIFSLTIAFLDKIDPKLLWGNFQFKDLSAKNIKAKNFFEWATTAPKDFNLVIGNPPFNVVTEYKKRVKEHHQKFITPFQKEMGFKYSAPIPDNFAFYFLEFAKQLSPQKKVCLIIPTTLLLYSPQNTSINYRKALFENSNVEKIYDFTHLREILFTKKVKGKGKTEDKDNKKSGRTPVCAIILNNSEPLYKSIEHTVIKRLVSTEKKLRFEIDHYDRHFVRFDWACRYPFVWKCNLLGGGRLFHLIYRLSLLQNLKDFIKEKQKENSEWIFGQGYIVGTPPKDQETINYLYGQDLVSHITENGEIVPYEDKIIENKNFEGKRVAHLFRMPLLLLHQKIGEGKLPIGIKAMYDKNYLGFSSIFSGIHAPKEDADSLQKIYDKLQFHKDTYMLWILTNSSKSVIYHETTITKTDLDTLPFPDFTDEEEEYLELSSVEEILRDDVLNYYIHLGKGIKEGKGKIFNQKVSPTQLQEYGQVFCRVVNSLYEQKDEQGNPIQKWQIGRVYQTPHFTIYEFVFGKVKDKEFDFQIIQDFQQIDKSLHTLIFNSQENQSAIYTRLIREYDYIDGYDTLVLMKPNNLRYWLKSIALRDADDTIWDYYQAGF